MIRKAISFFIYPILDRLEVRAEKFLIENPDWVWEIFNWMLQKGFIEEVYVHTRTENPRENLDEEMN